MSRFSLATHARRIRSRSRATGLDGVVASRRFAARKLQSLAAQLRPAAPGSIQTQSPSRRPEIARLQASCRSPVHAWAQGRSRKISSFARGAKTVSLSLQRQLSTADLLYSQDSSCCLMCSGNKVTNVIQQQKLIRRSNSARKVRRALATVLRRNFLEFLEFTQIIFEFEYDRKIRMFGPNRISEQ